MQVSDIVPSCRFSLPFILYRPWLMTFVEMIAAHTVSTGCAFFSLAGLQTALDWAIMAMLTKMSLYSQCSTLAKLSKRLSRNRIC